MEHRVRQAGLLGVAHASEKNRHQQSGALVISDLAAGNATDKELDLVTRKLRAVPFSANDVLWSQIIAAALPLDVRKGSAFPEGL